MKRERSKVQILALNAYLQRGGFQLHRLKAVDGPMFHSSKRERTYELYIVAWGCQGRGLLGLSILQFWLHSKEHLKVTMELLAAIHNSFLTHFRRSRSSSQLLAGPSRSHHVNQKQGKSSKGADISSESIHAGSWFPTPFSKGSKCSHPHQEGNEHISFAIINVASNCEVSLWTCLQQAQPLLSQQQETELHTRVQLLHQELHSKVSLQLPHSCSTSPAAV